MFPEAAVQQRLLFLPGALAGVIFFTSVHVLGSTIDGYSHIAQSVSEIGRQGSPAQVYAQFANLLVAVCLLVFAWGLHRFARNNAVSGRPALIVAFYGISLTGTVVFPTPHPLHNVLGLSMTIGYMAPLVSSLSWRNLTDTSGIVAGSWIAFILIVISIFLNFSPLFTRELYPLE
jgi:hypothetical protein